MRGEDQKQAAMFSYVTMERRIAPDHPIRAIRVLVDRALARMNDDFECMYSHTGRPSIAPERLLRAQLLMALYSIRSEPQLMEQLDYNLLFRWFVGLEMDDPIWDVSVFTKNRERLIAGQASQLLLDAVLEEARAHNLLSEEHFTVDGTLIAAWAAARSFKAKEDPPAPGQGSGSGGEVLLRDKVESTTDPEARLYKKAAADKAVPAYLGHALIENRHGLVMAAEATQAATVAEREAAVRMLDRTVDGKSQRKAGLEITLGADTQYQDSGFAQKLRDRGVAPHISQYTQPGRNLGKNSLTEEERVDPRRAISQTRRKLIEKVFGWAKRIGTLGQVRLRGLQRVDWLHRLVMATYNLVRMRRLIPITPAAL
ncbi:MAG TPA: IS5 family transposase [Candidatus Saccharimonadales bacterium]|nr:IS5 family transposase [Candidatus Saccharimonadales bacterium]